MSRPSAKDPFAEKPGFFSWLRDTAYNFVYYDIGTGLDVLGDLFRGPSSYTESLHRQTEKAQARTPDAKPLTKADKATFAEMLRRTPSEPQMVYWKRKKALLQNPDKAGLVKQQRALEAAMAKGKTQQPKIKVDARTRSQPIMRAQTTKQTKTRTRR